MPWSIYCFSVCFLLAGLIKLFLFTLIDLPTEISFFTVIIVACFLSKPADIRALLSHFAFGHTL